MRNKLNGGIKKRAFTMIRRRKIVCYLVRSQAAAREIGNPELYILYKWDRLHE